MVCLIRTVTDQRSINTENYQHYVNISAVFSWFLWFRRVWMLQYCEVRFCCCVILDLTRALFTNFQTVMLWSRRNKIPLGQQEFYFSLLWAYHDVIWCSLMGSHLWNSCTAHVFVRSKSLPNFPNGFCQVFAKILCNFAAQVVSLFYKEKIFD